MQVNVQSNSFPHTFIASPRIANRRAGTTPPPIRRRRSAALSKAELRREVLAILG